MTIEKLNQLKREAYDKREEICDKISEDNPDYINNIYESRVHDLHTFIMAIDDILFSLYDYVESK